MDERVIQIKDTKWTVFKKDGEIGFITLRPNTIGLRVTLPKPVLDCLKEMAD